MAAYVTEETNKRARQGSHQDVITFSNAPLFLIYLEHPLNYKPLNSAQPVKTPGQSLTALQYFHLQQDFSYFCLGQEFHSHNVSRLNLKQDEEDSSKISLVVTPRDRLGVGACLFFLGCALHV